MFDDPIKFYLVREKQVGNLKNDFDQIASYLGTYGDIGLHRKNEGSLTISYPETLAKSTLETSVDTTSKDFVSSQQITLTCERYDNFTVNVLKNITAKIGYRIYNPQNNSYLINDPALMDLTTIELGEKMLKIFKYYSLVPLYNYNNTQVYYAKKIKDGSIHLINTHLLGYLLEDKSEIKKQKDFSVKVAGNISEFIACVDRGIIPIDFYKKYYDKSLVFNISSFNVDKLIKDVFVIPVFFKLDAEQQRFVQLNERKYQSAPVKISKGTSVEEWTKKMLKKIKAGGKIISIKIARQIDYRKDSRANLTPLLRVSIFLDEQSN